MDARIAETGSLRYSTQAYSKGKRTILIILYLISIAIPTAMVIRALQLYGPNFNVYMTVMLISTVLLIVGVEYVLVGIVVWRFVSPRLEIFENGMTRFVIPVLTNRKGDFVAFSDMMSFSVSEDGRTCAVLVEGSERPLIWMSSDPGDTRLVVDELRREAIKETEY